MAITSVSPNDPLLQWINNNATSEDQAIEYLEANLNVPPADLFQDIAVYLAASTNINVNPNAGQAATATTAAASSGLSVTTIFGMVTGIASAAGLAEKFLPPGTMNSAILQGVMKEVGTGALAAFLQYKVFTQSEKTAEQAQTANIAELGGLALAATAATMLWLSSFNPNGMANANDALYDFTTYNGLFSHLWNIIRHGQFSINPASAFFWPTVAVAGAITAAVVTAGVITGRNGSVSAPITPTGNAVKSMLASIPDFTQLLPKSSVVFLTGALTLGSMSYSLTPTNLYMTSPPIPTVTLASALGAASGQTLTPGSLANEIFVEQGAGPNGSDTVLLVTPGPNGTSTVTMFAVNANGYLIGNSGPDMSDLPIFQPTANGQGVTTNPGALVAFDTIPACMAIANNTSMKASDREGALQACMRANKDVTLIPSVPSASGSN